MSKGHHLLISDFRRETPSAVSIAFEVPDELQHEFEFKAGQYLTLEANIDGEAVRRAYSICAAPESGELRVAIKEVPNGRFSSYANQRLQQGDSLRVFPPEGRFVFDSPQPKHVGAFAAGSGITPLLSIAKTVLNTPDSRFTLLYGNKTQEDALFYDALHSLKKQYPSQFFLHEIYSQERVENALFGRMDGGTVKFVCKQAPQAMDAFYICGPEPMIHTVKDSLLETGADEAAIFFELFTPAETAQPVTTQNGNAQVTVVLDEETFAFDMRSTTTLLEAALSQKIDAPYSCQGGVCSSCIARISEGTAEMEQNQILTDDEIAEGLVLTCQAHPTSASLRVDFDDV